MTIRTVYVMQSAHTDLGYTHPREQIERMYLAHYDRVLELCARSADAPLAHRFKWTCETSWQVRHYLHHRPERQEDLLALARSGQVEVTATDLHFTDLIDADGYREGLRWGAEFCHRHALPLTTAVHCDINGWPWAAADAFADIGVTDFLSQIHIDSGTDPLGRRGSAHYQWLLELPKLLDPAAPVRLPQAFWWEGPGGGRVLHWLGEHYTLGNVLGVSSPQNFHADKTARFTNADTLTVDDLYRQAERELPRYLERLERDGYGLDVALLSTGGYNIDNAPPDDRWCAVIERWNADQGDVRLHTCTPREWFQVLRERDQGVWATHRVAWPDHWAHGLGSMTNRVAQARRTQRRRLDARRAVQTAGPGAVALFEDALGAERLALEHTFGAWSTTARPDAPANEFQQAAKELAFHQAELRLDEALDVALALRHPDHDPQPHLHVLGAEQDAAHLVEFRAADHPLLPDAQLLAGPDGSETPFQLDHDAPPTFVTVARARSWTAFTIVPGRPPPVRRGMSAPEELRSDAWNLRLDPGTGTLLELHDLMNGVRWDVHGLYRFGEVVHERVVHPLGRDAVGNLARFVALDVATDAARARLGTEPVVERRTFLASASLQRLDGPVFDALSVAGDTGQGPARVTWRVYHDAPVVELVLDWRKTWSDAPEAAYVAFPFSPDAQLEFETGGGYFRPGHHGDGGQLPGTCSSYYTVQRAARLTRRDGSGLLWLPLDAPLVMTNALDYNRWETDPYDWNGFLASMPVNHYWHTNFPTSQRGRLRLRYRFVPFAPGTAAAALDLAMPKDALGWR